MEKNISNKYYTYVQNNSGGSFVKEPENGIDWYVIIEAINSIQANAIAENIGIYFDGCRDGIDCSCCGDRWYVCDESDGKEFPKIFGEIVNDTHSNYYIHFIDGNITNQYKLC